MDWDLNTGRLSIRTLIFHRPQMREYRCTRIFTAPPNVSTYGGTTRLYLYRFIYSRCPMILPYHYSPPRERDGILVIIRLVGPRIHLTDPPTESKRTASLTRLNPAASSSHSAARLMEPHQPAVTCTADPGPRPPWRLRYSGLPVTLRLSVLAHLGTPVQLC